MQDLGSKLEQFLEALPADSGFVYGLRERQAVHELLTKLFARGELPAEPQRLANLVSPVVCGTRAQRDEFEARFAAWFPAAKHVAPGPAPEPDQGWRWVALGVAMSLATLAVFPLWWAWTKPLAAIEESRLRAPAPGLPANWDYGARIELSGKILLPNGTPAAGADVWLAGQHLRTGTDGAFAARTPLTNDGVFVLVAAEGHLAQYWKTKPGERLEVRLRSPEESVGEGEYRPVKVREFLGGTAYEGKPLAFTDTVSFELKGYTSTDFATWIDAAGQPAALPWQFMAGGQPLAVSPNEKYALGTFGLSNQVKVLQDSSAIAPYTGGFSPSSRSVVYVVSKYVNTANLGRAFSRGSSIATSNEKVIDADRAAYVTEEEIITCRRENCVFRDAGTLAERGRVRYANVPLNLVFSRDGRIRIEHVYRSGTTFFDTRSGRMLGMLPQQGALRILPNGNLLYAHSRLRPVAPSGWIWLIPALPFCALLAYWYWLYRKRARLRRFSLPWESDTRSLAAPAADPLYAGLRPLVSELNRRKPTEPGPVAVEPTIHATIRRGGYLTPVFATRTVVREYLILIHKVSASDQLAKLHAEFISKLKAEHALVEAVTFHTLEAGFDDGGGRPVGVEELAARYPHHDVWVLADPVMFVDPLTRALSPALGGLSRWTGRAVLSPVLVEHWLRQLLEAEGFRVADATPEGLRGLAQTLEEERGPAASAALSRFPQELRELPARWMNRTPPPDEEAVPMLSDLRRYVGAEGIRLVSACALYPELNWPLTRWLAGRLGSPGGRELLLTRVGALPWFRHGWMPDWLRVRLLKMMPEHISVEVRAAVEEFLLWTQAGGGDVKYGKAGEPAGDVGKPLRDYVMMTFLAGEELDEAQVVRPPSRLKRLLFGGGNVVAGVRWRGQLLGAMAMAWLLFNLVDHWAGSRGGQVVLSEWKLPELPAAQPAEPIVRPKEELPRLVLASAESQMGSATGPDFVRSAFGVASGLAATAVREETVAEPGPGVAYADGVMESVRLGKGAAEAVVVEARGRRRRALPAGPYRTLMPVAAPRPNVVPPARVSQTNAVGAGGGKVAFVVAVEKVNGMGDTGNAPLKDAEAMGQILQTLGYKVERSGAPTAAELRSRIAQWLRGIAMEESVIFYYSGFASPAAKGEPCRLLAADREAVDLDWIASNISVGLHESVLLLVDSFCGAGQFQSQDPSVHALLAGAPSYSNQNGGLFTQALLRSLRQPGLTLGQITQRLRAELGAGKQPQMPVYVGRKADLVLNAGVTFRSSTNADTPAQAPPPSVNPAEQRPPAQANPVETATNNNPPAASREIRRDVNPRDGLRYVEVPAGASGPLGCPQGLTDCQPFWMGETEVTVEAYRRVMERGYGMPPYPVSGKYELNPGWKDGGKPIVNVTLEEAASYCRLVGGRLPSLDEWNLAGKDDTQNIYEVAWLSGNSGSTSPGIVESLRDDPERIERYKCTMHAVGTRKVSSLGLFDMRGNVSEWVPNVRRLNGLEQGQTAMGGSWADANAAPVSLSAPRNIFTGFRCLMPNAPGARPATAN